MIAIIGGGPAGIALAAALDKRAIAYDLFEARQFGATWAAAPPDLRVLSPWWTNVLRARELLNGNPFRKPYAGEYLDHLLRCARDIQGNVRELCEIQSLQKSETGGWILQTVQGHFGPYASVVLATGYFFAPRWPSPATVSDDSVPVLHASQIGNYTQLEQLRSGPNPVVVVGRRVTAGQLLVELHRRGIACALSLRSTIEYRRHGPVANLREAAYFFWEELQARLRPGIKRPSYPVMDGGLTRHLVDSGQVEIWPTIDRIEDGQVCFTDGRRLRASAVIMATGYRAMLDLLPSPIANGDFDLPPHTSFEVRAAPGLYMLGFDNLFDHRSRYLRGIRFDAIRLANILSLRASTS